MIKQLIFAGVLVLASAMTGEAMAQCSTNRVNTTADLNTVLSGNTICVSKPGGWSSQEEHFAPVSVSGAGQLWDYKCGTSDPATLPGTDCENPNIDRRKQLGTWQVSGSPTPPANTTVTYLYTAFGPPNVSATYQVYKISGALGTAGSIYEFCTALNATPSATGTLKLGTGAGCP